MTENEAKHLIISTCQEAQIEFGLGTITIYSFKESFSVLKELAYRYFPIYVYLDLKEIINTNGEEVLGPERSLCGK